MATPEDARNPQGEAKKHVSEHVSEHAPEHALNAGSAHGEKRPPTRRDILRVGGWIAAGLAAGVAGGAAVHRIGESGEALRPEAFRAPKARAEPGFDHLVVVMGENRSFDNLLGWVYTPETIPNGQQFEGLAFGKYQNTASDGTVVPAHIYQGQTDSLMGRPNPDPGEEFPHVNTQLFGTIDPADNANRHVGDMDSPWNTPKAGTQPTMSGFVRDYEINVERLRGEAPDAADRDQIMGSFSPEMLPVLSTLAQGFAVYDHWFCAVPSQTFCNRSFFHASTSHGFVTNRSNGGYKKWLSAAPTPTVFSRLEEAGRSWRIYFDKLQLISFTGMIHAPVLEKYWRTEHFATMEQFHKDAAEGTLPDYAFIEPRMIYNHNDFHPPVGKARESEEDGTPVFNGAISDVRAGDALIHEIYETIRTSASEEGSNALNTTLLITFDEHGGTYDHVAPPEATPPTDQGPGEMGFTFDRLGCRVPAIVISAYTNPGTVIQETMHHGSLMSTLSERFGLESLTKRDHGAPTLSKAHNNKQARHPAEWPRTAPQYVPPNPEAIAHPGEAERERPLSPPAQGLLGLLLEKYGTEEEKQHLPETFGEAYDLLNKYGQGLFGVG